MDRWSQSTNWRTDRNQEPKTSPYPRTWRQENDHREKLRRLNSEKHSRGAPSIRELASASWVYVGNLRYVAQREDIEKLFAEAGLEVYV